MEESFSHQYTCGVNHQLGSVNYNLSHFENDCNASTKKGAVKYELCTYAQPVKYEKSHFYSKLRLGVKKCPISRKSPDVEYLLGSLC